MKNETSGFSSHTKGEMTAGHKNEWMSFFLLAVIGLPVVMVGAIVVYGFAVWFSQILFFGPPS